MKLFIIQKQLSDTQVKEWLEKKTPISLQTTFSKKLISFGKEIEEGDTDNWGGIISLIYGDFFVEIFNTETRLPCYQLTKWNLNWN